MKNFWQDLPRPFFILAPMEEVTDIVFRHVIAAAGPPDVYFTEFTNAASYFSEQGRHSTRGRLAFSEDEQPMVAQIWGSVPEHFEFMGKALKEKGFAGIDINMGCPVKHAVKSGGGSGLIRTPELAAEIIAATKKSGLPVSVKTRLGFSSVDEMHDWLGHILRQDIVNLTIHLRSRKEMSKVPAHYELIPEIIKLRDEIAPQTLLTINGDIRDREHGMELVQEYGVDGVMIGRGVFTNPFAFAHNEVTESSLTSKQFNSRLENKSDASLSSAKLATLKQSSKSKDTSDLFSGQIKSASSSSKASTPRPARVAIGGAAPENVFVNKQKILGADQSTGPETSDLRDDSGTESVNDGSDRKHKLLTLLDLHLDLFDRYSRELEPRKYEPLKRFFKIYVRDFAGASELREKLMHTKSTEEVRALINTSI